MENIILFLLVVVITISTSTVNFTMIDPSNGDIGNSDFNFVSEYDGLNPYPGSRLRHSSAYGNGTLHIFGGDRPGSIRKCDYWRYFVDENKWVFVEADAQQRGDMCYRNDNFPGRGNGIPSVFHNSHFYLIGGYRAGYNPSALTNRNDIWRINTSSVDWEYIGNLDDSWDEDDNMAIYSSSPTRMGGRSWACTVRRNETSSLYYIFGGQGYNKLHYTLLNDVWSFDMDDFESGWSLEYYYHETLTYDLGNYDDISEPLRPVARSAPCCWSLNEKLYLFSGLAKYIDGDGESSLSDMWTFDYRTGTFDILNFLPEDSEEPLYAFSSTFDSFEKSHPGQISKALSLKIDDRSVLIMFGQLRILSDEVFYANIWRYDLLYNRFVLIEKHVLDYEGIYDDNTMIGYPGGRMDSGGAITEDNKIIIWGGYGYDPVVGINCFLGRIWMITDSLPFTEPYVSCGGYNVSTNEYVSEACTCGSSFYGADCSLYKCFGVPSNSTRACSRHGQCIGPNVCVCDTNYTDSDCSVTTCYDVESTHYENVCDGHGLCESHDNCTCLLGYSGRDCDLFGCGMFQRESDDVCSGHGVCSRLDYCSCDLNYRLGSDNVTCIICNVGYISDPNDPYNCQACPSGYSSTPANSSITTCFACTEGMVEEGGECHLCPSGTYQPNVAVRGFGYCLPCPPGYFSEVEGVAEMYHCSACPAGFRQPNSGANDSDACVHCAEDKLCPKGSPTEFQTLSGTIEESIFHSKQHNIKAETVSYTTKLIIFGSILFSAFLLIVIIFLCSYTILCCCCGRTCMKGCFSYSAWDRFFSMSHDVNEKESPVKKSTVHGGVFSILALSVTFTLISWSCADFYLGNKRIRERTEFFFLDNENPLRGDMLWGATFLGDYENCTVVEDFAGFSYDSYEFNVWKVDDVVSDVLGCKVELDCNNCSIVDSENLMVSFSLDFENQFNRMVEFYVVLPHCDTSQTGYRTEGRLFTNNGTLTDSFVNLALFRSEYQKISLWDLLLGLIDTKVNIDPSLGLGASILSVNKKVEDNVMAVVESGKSEIKFSFDVKLSNFAFVVEEYFHQSLLNLVAQLFALFGLSISVMGVFFGLTDKLVDGASRIVIVLWSLCGRKKGKVYPIDGKEEKGEGDDSSDDKSDDKEEQVIETAIKSEVKGEIQKTSTTTKENEGVGKKEEEQAVYQDLDPNNNDEQNAEMDDDEKTDEDNSESDKDSFDIIESEDPKIKKKMKIQEERIESLEKQVTRLLKFLNLEN